MSDGSISNSVNNTFVTCILKIELLRYRSGGNPAEKMITLITIQKESNGGYLFHVTSPKGSDPVKITAATYEIGWDLFDKMDAAFIYTMVPTFNGHVHKGSKMQAESCGLTLCGEPEVEIDGRWHYSWQPYSLTRADWTKYHGKTENTAIAV